MMNETRMNLDRSKEQFVSIGQICFDIYKWTVLYIDKEAYKDVMYIKQKQIARDNKWYTKLVLESKF